MVRTQSAETHYIRARIQNIGRVGAENVEVSVIGVKRKGADGAYHVIPMATPWNLTWAHIGSQVLPRLPVGSQRHIDLGHVVDPARRALIPGEDHPSRDSKSALFCLAFFVKSNTGEYLLDPGDYRIDLQIFSANSRPSEVFTFQLSHKGRWAMDETQMYGECLGLQIVRASSLN